MNITGQTNLLNTLNQYTIDSFPKSSILVGERGCGKHLISSYIAEMLKLSLIDITENISQELITSIYENPIPAIYLINTSKITEKEQNMILKLLEEPLKGSFILLLCENKSNLLPTVLNRCISFEFSIYTKAELSVFLKDINNRDLILDIIRTPGQAILTQDTQMFLSIKELCDKLTTKLIKANYVNTLSITDKIKVKEEDINKFDIQLFFDIFLYTLKNQYLSIADNVILKIYIYSVNARKKLSDNRLNKAIFMDNYLTNL